MDIVSRYISVCYRELGQARKHVQVPGPVPKLALVKELACHALHEVSSNIMVWEPRNGCHGAECAIVRVRCSIMRAIHGIEDWRCTVGFFDGNTGLVGFISGPP